MRCFEISSAGSFSFKSEAFVGSEYVLLRF